MTVTKLRLATWPGEQFVCGLGLSFTRACRLGTGTEATTACTTGAEWYMAILPCHAPWYVRVYH